MYIIGNQIRLVDLLLVNFFSVDRPRALVGIKEPDDNSACLNSACDSNGLQWINGKEIQFSDLNISSLDVDANSKLFNFDIISDRLRVR